MDPKQLLAKYDEIAQQLNSESYRLAENNLGVIEDEYRNAFRAVAALVDRLAALR